MSSEGDRDARGLLGRWARRKSAVRRGERPPEADAAVGETPAAGSTEAPLADDDPVQAAPRERAVDLVEGAAPRPPLPPVDSLDEHSDYAGFMSREVDATLRRAALRKLFSAASLNVTDGLDDYAEDFTNFKPLGGMITADLRLRAEREAARRRRENEAAQGAAQDRSSAGEAAESAPGEEDATAAAPQQQALGETATAQQPAEEGDSGRDVAGGAGDAPPGDVRNG